jgi:hypothetical protein
MGVHAVYTLPSKLRNIAYQNKRLVYDLLMSDGRDNARHRQRSRAPLCADRITAVLLSEVLRTKM